MCVFVFCMSLILFSMNKISSSKENFSNFITFKLGKIFKFAKMYFTHIFILYTPDRITKEFSLYVSHMYWEYALQKLPLSNVNMNVKQEKKERHLNYVNLVELLRQDGDWHILITFLNSSMDYWPTAAICRYYPVFSLTIISFDFEILTLGKTLM